MKRNTSTHKGFITFCKAYGWNLNSLITFHTNFTWLFCYEIFKLNFVLKSYSETLLSDVNKTILSCLWIVLKAVNWDRILSRTPILINQGAKWGSENLYSRNLYVTITKSEDKLNGACSTEGSKISPNIKTKQSVPKRRMDSFTFFNQNDGAPSSAVVYSSITAIKILMCKNISTLERGLIYA